MAATILVKEAVWRACALLEDCKPQFTRWTEHELISWLGDAQLAIAKFLPTSAARIDAIKLKAGTRQSIELIAAADCKPGDGAPITDPVLGMQVLDVICNMGSEGLTRGRAIRMVSRELLDVQRPSWHGSTSSEVSSYTHDPRMPRYFYVSPGIAAGQNVWVEVAFTAQPVAIPNTGTEGAEIYKIDGASTTKISIADEHIDDIVNYMAARAHLKNAQQSDGDAKFPAFVSLFVNSINAKVTAMTGNNPNLKRLPFAPEPIGAAS